MEKLYASLTPHERPVFGGLGDRAREQVRQADIAATQALLDWHPQTDLDAGLQATIHWYCDRLEAGNATGENP